jgi:hypothetical protein
MKILFLSLLYDWIKNIGGCISSLLEFLDLCNFRLLSCCNSCILPMYLGFVPHFF